MMPPLLGESSLHDMSSHNPMLLIGLHRRGCDASDPWNRANDEEKDREGERDEYPLLS
jgi:hypothetical protein